MSEGFYITCECGYELYIPEASVGKVQECINCSAQLDTQPAAINPEKDSTKEAHIAPFEPTAVLKPDHSSFQSASSYNSPFEDADDVIPLNPQPNVSTGPAAPVSESEVPTDYAASIFEDTIDDPAPVDISKPDPSLIRTYQDPEHTSAYQDTTEQETCPRCGNPYRGDWDKQRIGKETICFICSNQATEGLPERLVEDNAVSRNPVLEGTGWSGSINTEIPDGPIEETFWLFNPESNEFRIMIYALAFGMIFLAIGLFMFTDSNPLSPTESQSSESSVAVEVQPELPIWVRILYYGGLLFFVFLGQFMSIYSVLLLTNRLPHGRLSRDFVIVGITMGILTILSVLYYIFAATIGSSMLGPVFMMIANVGFGFICITIMINLLDFRIRDFFYLIFVSGFVQTLVMLIGSLYFAALAAIAL